MSSSGPTRASATRPYRTLARKTSTVLRRHFGRRARTAERMVGQKSSAILRSRIPTNRSAPFRDNASVLPPGSLRRRQRLRRLFFASTVMFALFERLLPPTAMPEHPEPPAGLAGFYWHFARQAKG